MWDCRIWWRWYPRLLERRADRPIICIDTVDCPSREKEVKLDAYLLLYIKWIPGLIIWTLKKAIKLTEGTRKYFCPLGMASEEKPS